MIVGIDVMLQLETNHINHELKIQIRTTHT
jgi:hypothetical protein